MTSIVIVNDGQTRWAANKAELVAALDRLGWERTQRLGQHARIEPASAPASDCQPTAYTDLCEEVQPVEMPTDANDLQTLTYYEAEQAWLWSAR